MDIMRQVTFVYVGLFMLLIAESVEGSSIQEMDEMWGEPVDEVQGSLKAIHFMLVE